MDAKKYTVKDENAISIRMGIVVFVIVIWGGKSSVLWSKSAFYSSAGASPLIEIAFYSSAGASPLIEISDHKTDDLPPQLTISNTDIL